MKIIYQCNLNFLELLWMLGSISFTCVLFFNWFLVNEVQMGLLTIIMECCLLLCSNDCKDRSCGGGWFSRMGLYADAAAPSPENRGYWFQVHRKQLCEDRIYIPYPDLLGAPDSISRSVGYSICWVNLDVNEHYVWIN